MATRIDYNEMILFKKSDFPLLKNIDDYEQDMDIWYEVGQEDFYAPDNLIESAAYRTYIYNKFQKNGKKDVKAYNSGVLFYYNNRGKLDFNISDYYVFYGFEYLS